MNRKIYILHGWAYSTEKWEPFVSKLSKEGIEPILLQIPGLTAPLKEVWDLEKYVQWLKKIVDLEKGKVILLGHSNGGRISLAFAAKYPETVARLILIDSAGVYHNELPIRLKRFVFGKIAKVGKVLTKSKQMKILLYRFVREHDYERADPIVRDTMRNLIRTDLQESFASIKAPTTIIWGAIDTITPASDAHIVHNGITNSSLHIINGARHSPMFTHVDEVVKIVVKVLK